MYKFQNKETPPALYDFVQLASAVHHYSITYATNQNLYARFRRVASQIWEAIPIEVKCLPFNTFNKEYSQLSLLTDTSVR